MFIASNKNGIMNLHIDNLSKVYPNGVKALSNINLHINKGMFGLLGPNGAGKSSLMRTIATLQAPDSGQIKFNKIDTLTDKLSLRKTLGYLPQEFGVYSRINAEKLLDYFARLKGVSSNKERKQLIDYCLEITNLTEHKTKAVSSYSGGMKQRFGIAQILLNNPKLIIVDEPTAGLDPAERQRFLNILREISTESIVIFSTHIVEDIKDLCTDMAILNNGKVLLHKTPELAIQALQNKIFTTNISNENLIQYKLKYNVLSSAFNRDNSLRIRVFSEEQLSSEFRQIEPNLEDVYFSYLTAK
jgi:ABC-type multidrug transport system ATPase subunit